MKVAILLASLVCIASSYPAPAPNAVDWGAVEAKALEIYGLIQEGTGRIKPIANEDNAQVGADIGNQIDSWMETVQQLLQGFLAAIESQTLTEEEARGYIAEFKDSLAQLQSDLQDELAQLSTGAAGQIRDIFYATFAVLEIKFDELLALLRA